MQCMNYCKSLWKKCKKKKNYRHFLHTRGKKLQKSDWCEIIILEDSTFRIRRVSWIYQKHFFLFSFTLSSCLQIPTLNKLTLRWADCSGLTTQSSDRAAWFPCSPLKTSSIPSDPYFLLTVQEEWERQSSWCLAPHPPFCLSFMQNRHVFNFSQLICPLCPSFHQYALLTLLLFSSPPSVPSLPLLISLPLHLNPPSYSARGWQRSYDDIICDVSAPVVNILLLAAHTKTH